MLRRFTSPGARRVALRGDVVAGLLVTAVAVPLAIGFAEVAGVPPALGLYTCMLPLVGFALFGSSPHLKLGLDAASAAMFATALAPLTVAAGPQRALALVATLTLLVGLLTLAAGLLRLGAVGELLSLPVLLGYQAGIAISVVLGQLPRLLGHPAQGANDVLLLADVLRHLPDVSATTVAVGGGSLLAMRLLRRRRPLLPSALVVLVVGTAASTALSLGDHGVALVGHVPSGLPDVALPHFAWADVVTLLPAAAAIAFVTSADVVATSRSFAARLRYRVNSSHDLVGLGAANLLSSVSGGLTTSASYARTAIAERAGSATQLSSIVAAAAMAGTLLVLTAPISYVPKAVLAAIVVDAVLGLVDVREFLRLWRLRRVECLVGLLALVGVLTVGLLWALGVAVAVSVALLLRRLSAAEWAVSSDPRAPRLLVFTWDAPLYFGNVAAFRRRLVSAVEARPDVEWVVVDGAAVSELDLSAVDELERLVDELRQRGVTLVVAEGDTDERALLESALFPGPLFVSVSDAVDDYLARRQQATS